MGEQGALFDLPGGLSDPQVGVIVLVGPSGSGKTSLTSRLGLPSLSLDNFYKDDDDPHLPYTKKGLIDWDDAASWKKEEALESLRNICREGAGHVPVYNIPTNKRTGFTHFSAGEQRVLIVEGIFASDLVEPLRREGLLLGAVCIARSPWKNAYFRLLRDLGEARKPIPTLLWRGIRLLREEPRKVRDWVSHGCEAATSLGAAETRIRELIP